MFQKTSKMHDTQYNLRQGSKDQNDFLPFFTLSSPHSHQSCEYVWYFNYPHEVLFSLYVSESADELSSRLDIRELATFRVCLLCLGDTLLRRAIEIGIHTRKKREQKIEVPRGENDVSIGPRWSVQLLL